jgi:hypothetical protein
VQPEITCSERSVNDALVGNVIEGNAEQTANAFLPILVTELGIVTEGNPVQPSNT